MIVTHVTFSYGLGPFKYRVTGLHPARGRHVHAVLSCEGTGLAIGRAPILGLLPNV